MTDRIEEIRRRLNNGEALYPDDPIVLLSRVEELEKERDKYEFWYETTKKTLVEAEDRIEELERQLEQRTEELKGANGVLFKEWKELQVENEQLQAACDNLAHKLSQRENELAEVMRGSEY